jgi:hypothetical protein
MSGRGQVNGSGPLRFVRYGRLIAGLSFLLLRACWMGYVRFETATFSQKVFPAVARRLSVDILAIGVFFCKRFPSSLRSV